MGQELRSIVLTDDEFLYAAGLYLEQTDEKLVSADNIDTVEVSEGADASAVVRLKTPLVDGKTEVGLEGEQMVETIVAFCRDRIIPLPKNGRKTVVRRDGNVILEIELDWF